MGDAAFFITTLTTLTEGLLRRRITSAWPISPSSLKGRGQSQHAPTASAPGHPWLLPQSWRHISSYPENRQWAKARTKWAHLDPHVSITGLQKTNGIGLNLYLESWNGKVFCIHMAGSHTEAKLLPVCCVCLDCWGGRDIRETKLPWTLAENKIHFFLNRTPSRALYRSQYLNSTEKLCKHAVQGCQGILCSPSYEPVPQSLVFQGSQGAQMMIKDLHPWPWDVKSTAHSYDDLRRTNWKVILAGARFNQSTLPPVVGNYSSDPHPSSSFYLWRRTQGMETSYSSLKNKTKTKTENHRTYTTVTPNPTAPAATTWSVQHIARKQRCSCHEKPSQHLPNRTCPSPRSLQKALCDTWYNSSCCTGSALKYTYIYWRTFG